MNDARLSMPFAHISSLLPDLRMLTLAVLSGVLAAVWVPLVAHAQGTLPTFIRDAESQLEDGRSTLDLDSLSAARSAFQSCVQQDSSNARCYYDLGRTDSYIAQAIERHKDKSAAQRALDSGIENMQRSIAIDASSADSHALLADLYGRKIGLGGMFAAMRFGPKAEAEAKRALELDVNNPQAYVVLGRKLLYSPKTFGGDVDKAIESFRKSTTVAPHYDEGFVWLAIAYIKKGDSGAAKMALDEALRLNSRSAVAQEMRLAMK
jgi:tetratricopeptide (TPR) repeat protein